MQVRILDLHGLFLGLCCMKKSTVKTWPGGVQRPFGRSSRPGSSMMYGLRIALALIPWRTRAVSGCPGRPQRSIIALFFFYVAPHLEWRCDALQIIHIVLCLKNNMKKVGGSLSSSLDQLPILTLEGVGRLHFLPDQREHLFYCVLLDTKLLCSEPSDSVMLLESQNIFPLSLLEKSWFFPTGSPSHVCLPSTRKCFPVNLKGVPSAP